MLEGYLQPSNPRFVANAQLARCKQKKDQTVIEFVQVFEAVVSDVLEAQRQQTAERGPSFAPFLAVPSAFDMPSPTVSKLAADGVAAIFSESLQSPWQTWGLKTGMIALHRGV